MRSKMFFFLWLKVRIALTSVFLNILGGALIFAPIIATIVVVGMVANALFPWLQRFSPFVPRYVSVLISLFILWIFGKYRKRINAWIDKPLSSVLVVGFVYKLLNNLAESLEDFLNKMKSVEDNIMFIPRSYTSHPELCYLMSRDIIWIWDGKLGEKAAYLSVNFASVPGLRGNNPIPVPKGVVDGYFANHKAKITIDDAIQYYASLGAKIPPGLLTK